MGIVGGLGVDKKEREINLLNHEWGSSQRLPASDTHVKNGRVPSHRCSKKNEPTPRMNGEPKAPMGRRAKCTASQELDGGKSA